MVLTSADIYNSIIYGAYTVIRNKETLNRINVFPVQDGDTGSNLSSMMRNIINKSYMHKSVKKTLESIADSAIYGARGNSGIIFAGYLNGLSETIKDVESITVEEYILASNEAVEFAYKAIENPVEGTMITLMKEWGRALLEESVKYKTLKEVFGNAFLKVEIALEKTKTQIDVLQKANVVDSGAKGFTYFIEGALYYIKTGEVVEAENIIFKEEIGFKEEIHHVHCGHEKYRYCTECLLESDQIDVESIKYFLSQKGNSTVVVSNKNKCRIHIHTNEPADVFEYLHDKGMIIYQKIDDMIRQKEIVNNKKSSIALITDSIADLPKEIIDKHQIHVIHLDILFEDRIYMDKLTVKPSKILDLADESDILPSSSQPRPKQIENLFEYLSTYYESAIVMTVSKELSGTYNSFNKLAKVYLKKGFKVSVINSKQNSGAEGLLVKACAELIEKNYSHERIIKVVEKLIYNSKILVQVKTLDNMIKSGRLSVRAGAIGKTIGMKPVITLDEEGRGALNGIAFSNKGSNKKVIQYLKKILKNQKIKEYAIVHVDNYIGAKKLADAVKKVVGKEPVYIEKTSSIVAVGAGRGAVAISYILELEKEGI